MLFDPGRTQRQTYRIPVAALQHGVDRWIALFDQPGITHVLVLSRGLPDAGQHLAVAFVVRAVLDRLPFSSLTIHTPLFPLPLFLRAKTAMAPE